MAIVGKINYAVDKLHIKGHKGATSLATVDPNLFPELEKSNTVVCEKNNFKVVVQPHNLHQLVEQAVEILQVYAKSQNVQIQLTGLINKELMVMIDYPRIQ